MSTAQYNAEAVSAWLATAYPTHDGLLHVCSVGDWVGRTFSREEHGQLVDYARQLDERGTAGIYLRATTVQPGIVGTIDPADPNPATAKPRRGSAEHAVELVGLWSDIDIAGPGHKTTKPLPGTPMAAVEIVQAAMLPTPTAWIHSGGGLYAWWLLGHAVPVSDDNRPMLTKLSEDWQAALKVGAGRLGLEYGTGVSDLARVLRLPGTVNRKTAEPAPCALLAAAGPRYGIVALAHAAAAVEPVKPEPPARPTIDVRASTAPAPGPRQRADGTESPVDHYNREATPELVLQLVERAGWELVSEDRDHLYVGRPGRSNEHSGSILRAGAGLYVWTDADVLFEQTPRGSDAHRPAHVWALVNGYAGGIRSTAAVAALGRAGYGDQTPRQPDRLGTLPPEPVQLPPGVAPDPAVELERASRKAALIAELRDSSGLDDLPRPVALIDGLVYRNEVFQIIGASGSLKSFVALSMAGSVATGLPWFGRDIRTSGPVLFIAAEGATGIRQRVRAWEQQTAGRLMDGVRFLGRPAQIAAKMDRRWVPSWDWRLLTEIAGEIGAVMILLDTQARSTVGVQESDNTEMGEIFEIIDGMRQATGASPGLVHHEGKNANGTGRGASAMYAATNSEIRVTRGGTKDTPRLTIANTKNKDQAAADDIHLYARAWPILIDAARPELGHELIDKDGPAEGDNIVTSLALALDTSERRRLDEGGDLRLRDDDGTRLGILRALRAVWAPDGPGFTKAEAAGIVMKSATNPAGFVAKPSFYRIWSELVRVGVVGENGNGARFRVTPAGDQLIALSDMGPVRLRETRETMILNPLPEQVSDTAAEQPKRELSTTDITPIVPGETS